MLAFGLEFLNIGQVCQDCGSVNVCLWCDTYAMIGEELKINRPEYEKKLA